MVNIAKIRQCNAKLKASTTPQVAVFVGATSGIGKITLAKLVRLGFPIKAYVIGRKETEPEFKPFLEELRAANPKADLVWIEGQVTLLAEVRRICLDIKARESKIDLLFLSAGYVPWDREETTEGIEPAQVLQFFGRILFTLQLLPLLRAAASARVISVFSGGMESGAISDLDGLTHEKPGVLGAIASQRLMGSMGTMTLERLAEAEENKSISFLHTYPGAVNTGNLSRGWPTRAILGPALISAVAQPLIGMLGYSFEESAERHLYMATSGAFGGSGPSIPGLEGTTTRGKKNGGLFLINQKCDTVLNEKNLADLRTNAQDKFWEKTQEVLRPYL